MNRAALKEQARAQIKGHIGILFVITLIVALLAAVATRIPYVGALAFSVVLTPAFGLAMVKIYLNLTKGINPEIGHLFSEIKNFWSAFKVTFLTGLYVALWSILFVIPGIVKAFAYSQAMFILAENPEIGAREALKRSAAMMDGHKMDMFVLYLSFIGWALLCVITLGIAYIWVGPFMSATFTNFYKSLKGEEEVPAIEEDVEEEEEAEEYNPDEDDPFAN